MSVQLALDRAKIYSVPTGRPSVGHPSPHHFGEALMVSPPLHSTPEVICKKNLALEETRGSDGICVQVVSQPHVCTELALPAISRLSGRSETDVCPASCAKVFEQSVFR